MINYCKCGELKLITGKYCIDCSRLIEIKNKDNKIEELGETAARQKDEIELLKKSCTAFMDKIKELESIMLEAGATTHKSKRLYTWYCANKEKQ